MRIINDDIDNHPLLEEAIDSFINRYESKLQPDTDTDSSDGSSFYYSDSDLDSYDLYDK